MSFSPVRQRSALFSSTVALCALLMSTLPAGAQDAGPHVSVATGAVSGEHGESNQSFTLGAGAPIGAGDFLNTDSSGRAEVALDDASMIRLGSDAQVRFVGVQTGNRRVQLAQGVLGVRLFSHDDLGLGVDTPSVSVRPLDAGSYRISVSTDGFTQVTVRSGRVEVDTPAGAQTIGAGTMLVAHGPASNPEITTTTPIAFDDFDRFNDDCDRHYGNALAQAPVANPPAVDPNANWPGVPPAAALPPASQPADGGPWQPSSTSPSVPSSGNAGQVIVNNGSGTIIVNNGTNGAPQGGGPSYQAAPPSYSQSGPGSAPYGSGQPNVVPIPSYAVPAGPPASYQAYPVPVPVAAPVLSVSVGWSQYSAQRGGYNGWRTTAGYVAAPRPATGWSVHASYSSGGSWGTYGAARVMSPSGYGASARWTSSAARAYPGGRASYGSGYGGGYRGTSSHASYGSVARR